MALSGGIGGAKLALGLSRVLPPDDLLVVANTGDDFEHLGLSISPDIDTLIVHAGRPRQSGAGWGRRDETWTFMGALGALGGDDWFRLGDRDLALHVERTRRLAAGETLSADHRRHLPPPWRRSPRAADERRSGAHACSNRRRLARLPGLFRAPAVPRRSCRARLRRRRQARAPSRTSWRRSATARLRAVVICPSNPFISIEPILAVPGVRAALARLRRPVVAVSPIVGGQRGQGPDGQDDAGTRARREFRVGGRALRRAARRLRRRQADADGVPGKVHVAPTLTASEADKDALARTTLAFADSLA